MDDHDRQRMADRLQFHAAELHDQRHPRARQQAPFEEIVLTRFPGRGSSVIQIAWTKPEGRHVPFRLDIRSMNPTPDGKLAPTSAGVSLALDGVVLLAGALGRALDQLKADASGYTLVDAGEE